MQKQEIERFLAEKRIAIVGVSRNKAKFGNIVYAKLKASGYEVDPVHPEMESLGADKCVPRVQDLPADTQALMLICSPDVCAKVLNDVTGTSISRIWIFPSKHGRSDVEADVQRLRDAGVSVISGLCPFMFLEPVDSVHSVHRFLVRLVGKYPR